MKPKALILMSLLVAAPAVAQQPQPDVALLAQAHDRCMVTHAVRLTHTAATDADIYMQATQACLSLTERLRAAVSAELPAAQASEVLEALDTQAESKFIALLARIRSDRARRAAQ